MVDMNIAAFKQKFDGGTRPNRFQVEINTPTGVLEPILVKAASIPAEQIGILQIPFRGRVAKLPGDRPYAEWTFTCLDDTTEKLRNALTTWHRMANDHASNVPDNQSAGGGADNLIGGGSSYYTDIKVYQLDLSGNPHTCVTLHECWPVEVGAVDLSYDTADTATEFACTIAYDWLTDCSDTPVEGESGSNTLSGSEPQGG
tara:strand:+ start:265 stop:867 length:603 start_codon:yes stop_codon:yes gene_type:complete